MCASRQFLAFRSSCRPGFATAKAASKAALSAVRSGFERAGAAKVR